MTGGRGNNCMTKNSTYKVSIRWVSIPAGARYFRLCKHSAIKGLFILALFFFMLTIGSLLSLVAEATDSGPDVITLKDFEVGARPVTFIHRDHGSTGEVGARCETCHHDTPENTTPAKCSKCHKASEENGIPPDIEAFHILCILCHTEEIKGGNSEVSIECISCHNPES